jgi:hypothetical protein
MNCALLDLTVLPDVRPVAVDTPDVVRIFEWLEAE